MLSLTNDAANLQDCTQHLTARGGDCNVADCHQDGAHIWKGLEHLQACKEAANINRMQAIASHGHHKTKLCCSQNINAKQHGDARWLRVCDKSLQVVQTNMLPMGRFIRPSLLAGC